nr:mapk-regulated corepressor-interacting protein 1 isoform X1 [Mirounga angustirostris]
MQPFPQSRPPQARWCGARCRVERGYDGPALRELAHWAAGPDSAHGGCRRRWWTECHQGVQGRWGGGRVCVCVRACVCARARFRITKTTWVVAKLRGYGGVHILSSGQPQRPRGPASGAQGPDTPAMTSSPVSRVVYNGKRNSSPRSPPSSSEIFTPAHEENVRFIYEAWQGVERDLRSQMSGSERGLVEEYVEKVPNPSLKTFKPIDLSDLKRRNTPDAKKS